MGTESTRRNRGCTQQEVKKCPFPEEMKELSPELSAQKGACALSAGVSQSLSKSPIYIKMPFQTCFDFTFPLSSPSPSRPTSQPHCPRSTRSGPSTLPAGKNRRERKELETKREAGIAAGPAPAGAVTPSPPACCLAAAPGDGAGRVPSAGMGTRCPGLHCRPGLCSGSGGRRRFQ